MTGEVAVADRREATAPPEAVQAPSALKHTPGASYVPARRRRPEPSRRVWPVRSRELEKGDEELPREAEQLAQLGGAVVGFGLHPLAAVPAAPAPCSPGSSAPAPRPRAFPRARAGARWTERLRDPPGARRPSSSSDGGSLPAASSAPSRPARSTSWSALSRVARSRGGARSPAPRRSRPSATSAASSAALTSSGACSRERSHCSGRAGLQGLFGVKARRGWRVA